MQRTTNCNINKQINKSLYLWDKTYCDMCSFSKGGKRCQNMSNMGSCVIFSAQKFIVEALKLCIKRSVILSKNNDSLNVNWAR